MLILDQDIQSIVNLDNQIAIYIDCDGLLVGKSCNGSTVLIGKYDESKAKVY